MPIGVYGVRIHEKPSLPARGGAILMGKIARQRYIENLSAALLNCYRQYEPEDPKCLEAQNTILDGFRLELQAQGKSRCTINDYMSCAVVRALDNYKKELKHR